MALTRRGARTPVGWTQPWSPGGKASQVKAGISSCSKASITLYLATPKVGRTPPKPPIWCIYQQGFCWRAEMDDSYQSRWVVCYCCNHSLMWSFCWWLWGAGKGLVPGQWWHPQRGKEQRRREGRSVATSELAGWGGRLAASGKLHISHIWLSLFCYLVSHSTFVCEINLPVQKQPRELKREWRNGVRLLLVVLGFVCQQLWMGCSGQLVSFLIKPGAWFWLLIINWPSHRFGLVCCRGWGGNRTLLPLLHHSAIF